MNVILFYTNNDYFFDCLIYRIFLKKNHMIVKTTKTTVIFI